MGNAAHARVDLGWCARGGGSAAVAGSWLLGWLIFGWFLGLVLGWLRCTWYLNANLVVACAGSRVIDDCVAGKVKVGFAGVLGLKDNRKHRQLIASWGGDREGNVGNAALIMAKIIILKGVPTVGRATSFGLDSGDQVGWEGKVHTCTEPAAVSGAGIDSDGKGVVLIIGRLVGFGEYA